MFLSRLMLTLTASALTAVTVLGATTPAVGVDSTTVIGTVDDTTFQLAPGTDGYLLQLKRDGAPEWQTTGGAVSLRMQGAQTPLAAPYSEVSETNGVVAASADITTPAGTTIHVTDSYSISDGALEVDRAFSVTHLAAADAGKGISLLFAIRATAPKQPQAYQWFAPGAWYGNGTDTFLGRNKLAFDGTETAVAVDALGAPLFAAFDSTFGTGVTLADRTPGGRQTVVADQTPQTSKTIVDASMNLPGLGVRNVKAGGNDYTELYQAYPAATINYRNMYSGKPSILRYLPLSAELAGETNVSLRLRSYDGFQDAVKTVWRQAYADDAKIIRRFDTKIHFDTLVDYVDASYGLDNGRRAYYTNYGLHQPYSGFLWRNADTAWVMLSQGWARQDAGMRDRARNVIADQLAQGGFVSSNQRTLSESHLNLMRAYLEDKAHGTENPSWLAKVRSYADGLPAAAPYYAVEVLLLLARETGNAAYSAKAEAGADAAWADGQKDMRFRGGLEDYAGGPPELDRESGYIALSAYMALYRNTNDPVKKEKWLSHAETAADFSETWSFVQDISMVPKGADKTLLMYGNDNVPAYGLSGIHAGASGGDAYQSMHAIDFYDLAEATGDTHYRDFAVYIERNSTLYTNMGDKAGLMADSTKNTGLGFGNEYIGTAANDYWNNNQRGDGNASNIGWLTYGMLAMTQRTLDQTGNYSLDASTLTDINGLNAYYQIVNKATGEALDIAGDARTDGAAVVTTTRDETDRAQQWLLQPGADGTLKLVNRSSAKVLAVPRADHTPGTGIVQAVFYPEIAYRFTFTDADHGWVTITSTSTSRTVEASPTTESDGHRVQQNAPTGSDYQQWRLVPVGDVQILDTTQPLAWTSDTAHVTAAAFDGNAMLSQRWSVRDADNGYVGIIDRSTGLAVTATGNSLALQSPTSADFNGFAFDQQWSIAVEPDGNIRLTNRAEPADARTVRLQTAGPATVDAPPSIIAVTPSSRAGEIGAGINPPATVSVTLSNGTAATRDVSWDPLPTTLGRHEVHGTVSDTQQRALLVVILLPTGGISSIDPVTATTTAGTAPTLPATVRAHAAGSDLELEVAWEPIDPARFAAAGQFTVSGAVSGTAVPAIATITVTAPPTPSILSVDPAVAVTTAGSQPTLPAKVVAHMSDGTEIEIDATWDEFPATEYDSPGYFTVHGTAGEVAVTAYVTVAIFADQFPVDGATTWKTGGAAPWKVQDGQLAVPIMASNASAYAIATTAPGVPLTVPGDFVMDANVTLRQTGNGGLLFRAPDANDSNGYYFGIEGHTQSYVVGKQINGTWNQFRYANAGTAPGVSHHLRVIVRGSKITYYADDMATPLFSATDTSFSAGTVGVRSWQSAMTVDNVVVRTLPDAIAVLPAADVHTTAGVAPQMPTRLPIRTADGSQTSAEAQWASVDSSAYAAAGEFEVNGTVAGLPTTVRVVVEEPAQLVRTSRPLVLTDPGVAPILPTTLNATYTDGHTALVPVTWDEIPAASYASSGYIQVSGRVTGTTTQVKATLGVTEFHDDYADGNAEGWKPYGGTWTVDAQHRYGVTLSGWSGLGEKSIAEGTSASDLVYQAKVTVTGGNDAGLVFRVTNPATGADSYSGYYAGISLSQKSVIFGRANGAWTQLASTPNWPGIDLGQEITVRVIASGNTFQIFVGDMDTPAVTYTDTAAAAPTTGAVGLRGYASSFRATKVQLAKLPPITAIHPVFAETLEGLAPGLPATVDVERMDGSITARSVAWQIDGVDLSGPTADIEGVVSGTDIRAHASITVHAATLTSTRTIDIITAVGHAPQLPASVTGRYSNGALRQIPVESWDPIAPDRYATISQFRVDGLLDADETSVRAHANVIVVDPATVRGPIVGFRTVTVSTVARIAPALPSTVTAIYRNGEEGEVPVTWDTIDPATYATPGLQFEVAGTVATTSLRPTVAITTRDDGAMTEPGKAVLNATQGWNTGLKDGDFEISMNMWWGQNAALFELYRDGTPVASIPLTMATPSAQKAVVDVHGLKNGTYTFTGVLTNSKGSTSTTPLIIKVTDASPGTPILSNDNWDHDGDYTITANLWWGTNATAYTFLENGVEIGSGSLTAATPAAQSTELQIRGRRPGTYSYTVEFANAAGSTTSQPISVTVR